VQPINLLRACERQNHLRLGPCERFRGLKLPRAMLYNAREILGSHKGAT
jgi:hypothetical protein